MLAQPRHPPPRGGWRIARLLYIICEQRMHNRPDENHRFKPPRFLVYYFQRLFIWGEWSVTSARYYHQRDLVRYQQYQAQQSILSEEE